MSTDDRDRLEPCGTAPEVRVDGDAVESDPPGRRLLRVLVCDNRNAADSLAILVKSWGHDVRVSHDGAPALGMIAAHRPDVLLLNITMPQTDGCRLAQQLRRQTLFKDALLIALTEYADEAHRLLCAGAGFDHYLVKPSEFSTLETLLRGAASVLPKPFCPHDVAQVVPKLAASADASPPDL